MKLSEIGWYDIKTKFKHLLRRCFYSSIMQYFASFIIASYMRFVYHSSKKYYENLDYLLDPIAKKQAIIISCWHNSIMLMPLLMYKINKIKNRCELNSLSSKHGDGRIVGNVMERFDFVNIAGSSNISNKKNRGISISDLKKIIKNLKKGHSLAITPDGPRGPRYKINSQLVNMAKMSGAKILPSACYISKSIRLNSWDHFILPLPFSKIYYYFDKSITIDKKITEDDIQNKNSQIEKSINICVTKAKEKS